MEVRVPKVLPAWLLLHSTWPAGGALSRELWEAPAKFTGQTRGERRGWMFGVKDAWDLRGEVPMQLGERKGCCGVDALDFLG